MLDFVAIDFETANSGRNSPCSLGAVIVKNGTIEKTFYSLIHPHDSCFYFDPFNTEIHGITEDDVMDSPELPDVWKNLVDDLNGSTLIAHFSSFDCSVIRYTFPLYDLSFPECTILCSRNVAKRQWPDLLSYGLSNVAELLNFDFIHHNALEDAKAAAAIIFEAARLQNANSCEELAQKLQLKLGLFQTDQYIPSRRLSPRSSKSIKIPECLDLTNPELNPDDYPFWDRDVVFTGTLLSMKREDAFKNIAAAGGRPQNAVNKKTDYLVMGEQDYSRFSNGEKSSKTIKAEELKAKGSAIEIISEADFLNMLGDKVTIPQNTSSDFKGEIYLKEIQPKFDESLETLRQICAEVIEPQRIKMNQRKYFAVIELDGNKDMPICCFFTKGNSVSIAFYDENNNQMERCIMYKYDALYDNSFDLKNLIRKYLGIPLEKPPYEDGLVHVRRRGTRIEFSIDLEQLQAQKKEE